MAIGYISDIVDPRLVERCESRIRNANLDALPMGVKNLEEMVVQNPWNPIPKVRYTERPDVVAAHLLEGHLVVLVDTTPMAMLAPVTFFHFLEHAEEFFQTPLIGTYLRWIRLAGFIVASILPPLWLALYMSPQMLPPSLAFIGPKETGVTVPIPLQFFLLEVGIDLIRMALIHTPSALGHLAGYRRRDPPWRPGRPSGHLRPRNHLVYVHLRHRLLRRAQHRVWLRHPPLPLPPFGFGDRPPPPRFSHRLRTRGSCPREDPFDRRSLPLAADPLSRPEPRQGALPAACAQSGASPAALWQPRERSFPGPNEIRPAFQKRQTPPTISEKMTFETALEPR